VTTIWCARVVRKALHPGKFA